MTTRSVRRKMVVGAGLAAGVMAAASASYACTNYKGNMTFATATASQTMLGDNLNDMGWCGGDPLVWNLTAPANSTQTFTVSSSAETGTCASQLQDDVYNVTVAGGQMLTGALPKHINCHNAGHPINVGTYTVAGGAGAGSGGPYTYSTASLRVGWNNICVWDTRIGQSDANDTNIKVV